MLVIVSRTSDDRDENGNLPQPFKDALLHPSGEWCIDVPERQFAGWVKTYGPVVAQVAEMLNGELAWMVEIYDQPRESDWPKTESEVS